MPPTASDIRRYQRRSRAEKLAAAHARRARAINGSWNGSFSAHQWERLLAECDYRCYLCGTQFPPDQLEPDHLLPLIRGGKNAIANIKPACHRCNSRKGSMTPEEYSAYLATKETKKTMPKPKPSRLEAAVLDVALPRNVRAAVRNHLSKILDDIAHSHGRPERYGIERNALGRLALLSGILYDDPNKLPAALRKTLLQLDLKTAEEVESMIQLAEMRQELDRLLCRGQKKPGGDYDE